ncbi:MAG: hypothetical protein AABX85_02865 [Nanoarchaeota archaeon]
MENEVLNDAENIFLVRPANNINNYVFAVRPSFAFRKKVFEASVFNPLENSANAFDNSRYWRLDEAGQEIRGSSTFLGLRFDKVIRPLGLWVPGVLEARVLDVKKELTNGVYRDFGMAVYDESNPNKEIAQKLAERAKKEGWVLPLLVPFRGLDYQLNPKAQYGVDVSIVEKPEGIVKGKDAVDVLNQFAWKTNSGAHGLYRFDGGGWCADDDDLAGSGGYGRVGDWICGEAARTDLAKAYDSLSERKYGAKIRELQGQMQKQKEAFVQSLEAN